MVGRYAGVGFTDIVLCAMSPEPVAGGGGVSPTCGIAAREVMRCAGGDDVHIEQ